MTLNGQTHLQSPIAKSNSLLGAQRSAYVSSTDFFVIFIFSSLRFSVLITRQFLSEL